jgi:hypothetical protein
MPITPSCSERNPVQPKTAQIYTHFRAQSHPVRRRKSQSVLAAAQFETVPRNSM